MVFVASLHRYPVKGLRGVPLSQAEVEPWGLAGDRRWMVVDGAGQFLTQRQQPRMALIEADVDDHGLALTIGSRTVRVARRGTDASPRAVTIWRDTVPAVDVGDAAAVFLTAALGTACRLVFLDVPETSRPVDPAYGRPGDHVNFADGFPLLLTTTASLRDLNHRLAEPIPMDRFRPNLVLDSDEGWAEDDWRQIRVGAVVFDVVKPCARCVVTTLDQRSGLKSPDNEPIRTLQRFRRDAKGQVLFGQNLIPRATGLIRIGDPVEILA